MGYIIELPGGQSWHIIAAKNAQAWIDKLASIMELKAAAGTTVQKLMVVRGGIALDGEKLRTGNFYDGADIFNPPESGWRKFTIRGLTCLYHKDDSAVICDIGADQDRQTEYLTMWSMLSVIYARVQKNGGLPLHAALIANNGNGIVLGGKGNIGKTTCCSRIPRPWHALCDDETLAVKTGPGQYAAHPFPTWSDIIFRGSDRTWNSKQAVPLRAIVFLRQSEMDKLIPLQKAEAAVSLNLFTSLMNYAYVENLKEEEKRIFRSQVFNSISEIVRSVPSYILQVSLTGRFWDELEKIEGMS